MPIVLVRIDDRLIHGQVIVKWVPFVHATDIIIADDEIEYNQFRRDFIEAMKIATPPEIKVEIYTIAAMVEKSIHGGLPEGNGILLFSKLEDFKKSLDLGFKTQEVNIGCIHSGDIEILQNITIKKEEAACLEEIRKNGIHLDLRSLPQSKHINLQSLSRYRKLIKWK